MKGKQIKLNCICVWQSLIVLRCVVDKALKSSYLLCRSVRFRYKTNVYWIFELLQQLLISSLVLDFNVLSVTQGQLKTNKHHRNSIRISPCVPLSPCLCLSLSVCPSVSLSLSVCVGLSLCLPVSVCLSLCVCVYMCVCVCVCVCAGFHIRDVHYISERRRRGKKMTMFSGLGVIPILCLVPRGIYRWK